MVKRESGSRFLMSIAALLVMSSMVMAQPTEQTFTILGAVGNPGEVDAYTECSLDGGATWQDAYLTGWHPWGFASGTNSWLSIDPDNSVGAGGDGDTLWYDFRIRFLVPDEFSDPSMVFVIKADNLADIWVNDTFISSVEGTFTYAAGDTIIEQAIASGLNEIRLRLGDYGGILGINFRIDVTMTSPEDISEAVFTTDEAEEYEETHRTVAIDIKPDSEDNVVNPRYRHRGRGHHRGVLPVAILTDDEFDATTVDVESLLFGPGGASAAHDGHFEDVDGDGDLDLMLHFPLNEIGITEDTYELWLSGTAEDGLVEITGFDMITIAGRRGDGCHGPHARGRHGRGHDHGHHGHGRHWHSEGEAVAFVSIPNEMNLAQNSPNPFNPTTNISYTVPEAGVVSLTVYNIQGKVVETLVDGFQASGSHNVEFNATSLSSGTYFYVLKANGQQQIKQMSFIK